jgi:phasin family protein
MRLMPLIDPALAGTSTRLAGEAALAHGRNVARAAARALERAKAPSHALAATTLKLGAVVHESVGRLLESQLQAWDGAIDESVRRLTRAADAEGLRPLIAGQLEMMSETRARIVEDARRTLGILADARAKIGDALAQSAARPEPARRGRKTAAQPTRKRKTTRRPARRPAARKPRRTH